MKKIISIVSVGFSICAAQGALMEDGFESYAVGSSVAGLNGWTVANATANQNALVAATNSPFSGGGKALSYNDNDTTATLGNLMLKNTLSENITEGVFSFDYNLDYAGWRNPTFFIQDETTGKIGVQLVIRDGNIMYKNGAGSTVTIADSALAYDTWYHFEITVADVTGAADTFDLRVTEEDLGSGTTEIANETGLEFFNDVNTMTRIDIGTWAANGSSGTRFHLDNVQVISGATGYAAWVGGWGGIDIGSETNDYDNDGVLNLYEYGLGGDPTNALDQGTPPVFMIVNDGGSNVFSYVHPQLSDANSGIAYFLELKTNLTSGIWINNGYTVTGTNAGAGTLSYITNIINTATNQKYIRLVIASGLAPSSYLSLSDFGQNDIYSTPNEAVTAVEGPKILALAPSEGTLLFSGSQLIATANHAPADLLTRFYYDADQFAGRDVVFELAAQVSSPTGTCWAGYKDTSGMWHYKTKEFSAAIPARADGIVYGRYSVPPDAAVLFIYTRLIAPANGDATTVDSGVLRLETPEEQQAVNFPGKLEKWSQFKSSTNANFDITLIGDSWTQGGYRIAEPLYRELSARYPIRAAGYGGFDGFSSQNVNGFTSTNAATVNRSGGWEVYKLAGSPDASKITTTIAGETVVVSHHLGAATDVKLFWDDDGPGSFRVRFDSGNWYTNTHAGTTGSSIDFLKFKGIGMPAAHFTMTIESLSGRTSLSGVWIDDVNKNGVVINKCARSGGIAEYFNNIDFQNNTASLHTDLFFIMFGTNEQGRQAPDQFKISMEGLVGRCRHGNEDVDLLLVTPARNGSPNHEGYRPMYVYRNVMLDIAKTSNAASLDLINVFGHSYDDYGYGSELNWFNSDHIHPSIEGAEILSEAVMDILGL